ncbi:hypothetical protein ACHHYP_07979 [Achlya hypogyna]|uniref:Uncharacterized protein n=1 Tax=Achlya hypogyna TaxID=1202772 RepID=A0A1V9YQ35_ACHHY|nr:hypothetical protein ACHHYP_07979 [Achlya hypogyna]
MGYGQSWLFRYPAPPPPPPSPVVETTKAPTPKRSGLRRPSSGDISIEPTEKDSLARMQDRDVGAFSMTPIAPNRLLVTTPWMVCDLQFLHETQQFHLSPLGIFPSSEDAPPSTMDDIDRAMVMAGTPLDASFLSSDVLHVSPDHRVLVLVYQELHGPCCLLLQPCGGRPGRQRFEQADVPLKTIPMTATVGDAQFFGAVLFRHDAIVAVGYTASDSTEATQLDAEAFAVFFPHLVGFRHAVTAYHSVVVDGTRIVALGCGNGVVHFVHGPARADSVAADFVATTFELDGPISNINVFSPRVVDGRVSCKALVSASIGYAVVYADPFDASGAPEFLPDSDYYDSLLCCASADVDFDGEPELLLGSFSNALVAYKAANTDGKATWTLEPRSKWDFFFFGPVYSIVVQDMNGDGVDEIVVASTDGIHVLEPDCDLVLAKLQAVLHLLQQQGQPETG